MKYFIFSDTHLKAKFDVHLFQFLVKGIQDADRVVINGDFFEGFLVSFEVFFKSEWAQLFPYLKAKSTVYILGDHDREYVDVQRALTFCDKVADELLLDSEKLGKVYIAHGDKLIGHPSHIIPFFARNFITKILFVIDKLKIPKVKTVLELNRYYRDHRLKQAILSNVTADTYIFGHTHHFKSTGRVLNSGSCCNHDFHALIIDL